MRKKKLMIPIIFALVLSISMFSGCLEESPVVTYSATDEWEFYRVRLHGYWSLQCNASNYTFVVDTESHENWEDYKYKFNADVVEHGFRYFIYYGDIPSGDYYFRAVAYCYDFKYFMKNYEEGWYQGEELSFYLHPDE